jgi:hypothetical protein
MFPGRLAIYTSWNHIVFFDIEQQDIIVHLVFAAAAAAARLPHKEQQVVVIQVENSYRRRPRSFRPQFAQLDHEILLQSAKGAWDNDSQARSGQTWISSG